MRRIVDAWRTEGVPLNDGASSSKVATLGLTLGIAVPDDIAFFYSTVNGMHDYAHDRHIVSFWSIDRILAEVSDKPSERVGFADALINSWNFNFVPLKPDGITVTSDADPAFRASSFTRFLFVYADTPDRLCL